MEIKQYNGIFYNGKEFSGTQDFISIEVPLSIAVNNVPFTVTMQTPGNETEVARGLLYTENIFRSLDYTPVFKIVSKDKQGYINSINILLPPELVLKDFAGTRNVISASSCGVCGKTTLDDLQGVHVENKEKLNGELIKKMFDKINSEQVNFKKSGGTHAAGAFTIEGELLVMMEDIGRHNAVDKVIGFLLNNKLTDKAKCLTVSGRISYEIVEKTKSVNIPFLASVSAPSSLAIDNAQESGITLLSFCRNEKFTVYSNPQQVTIESHRLITG